MTVSAKEVQELRKISGAGMMECKSALNDSNGDIKKAFKILREKGVAKAEKKSDREANEGLIGIHKSEKGAAIVEINSETDFVSRNNEFQELVDNILSKAVEAQGNKNVIEDCKDLINEAVGKIGENIVFRRLDYIEGKVYTYIHNKINDHLGKIGVLVKLKSETKELDEIGKNICMHIAALSPLSLNSDDLDENFLNAEKEIIKNQLIETGKPENIIENIMQGKINKIISEVVLLKQNFVMDNTLSIEQYLEKSSNELNSPISIEKFIRFELGN